MLDGLLGSDGNDCKFTGNRRCIELKLRNFLAVIPLSQRHRILSSLVSCSDYTLRTILLEMAKLAERTDKLLTKLEKNEPELASSQEDEVSERFPSIATERVLKL
ncbi:hypothetical protein K0M31_019074 [Melipona bicolor]|uniref:Uncharacterized protein n=1 Tax=Melipona bicolor TaxID=60889 RepID=A0AA40KR06_9HYME|nr:hypothetical protein K0M31_019074 [Melipona bicolor]